MSKRVSIIIVTYNSEAHIYDCLESVFQHNDIGNDLEVIVVDNNSQNTEQMFSKLRKLYGNRIILFPNIKNGGYGQGNNVGIRMASAPYIMVMNPDVRLVEPIFNYICRRFDLSKDICMIGMKQMYSSHQIGLSFDVDMFRVKPIWSILCSAICNRLNLYFPKYMYINGACFFIRKSSFEQIGLFDEKIFMYCEEFDIHYRLLNANKINKILFLKHLHYYHLAGNRDISINSFMNQFYSEIYCVEKFKMCKRRFMKNKILNINFFISLNILRGKSKIVSQLREIKNLYKEYYNENC